MGFRRIHSTFRILLLLIGPMGPFTHPFSLMTGTHSVLEMNCLYLTRILDECTAECLEKMVPNKVLQLGVAKCS
jgi:hypothetical protein